MIDTWRPASKGHLYSVATVRLPPPGSRGRGRSSYMLGGAFATFTISAGLMHSYAVSLVAFLEDFRWSRSEVSLA